MVTNALVVALVGLAVVVVTTVAWFRLADRVAMPENRFFFILLWSFAALLGVAGIVGPDANWMSAGVGVLTALGGVALLVVGQLGRQDAPSAIAVGDPMPEFSATDAQGNTFESVTLRGSPILLKFFRGHW